MNNTQRFFRIDSEDNEDIEGFDGYDNFSAITQEEVLYKDIEDEIYTPSVCGSDYKPDDGDEQTDLKFKVTDKKKMSRKQIEQYSEKEEIRSNSSEENDSLDYCSCVEDD